MYTRRVSAATTTLSTDASYRTLYTLAVGGMGRVDLAVRREGSFERLFAIKRLRPEFLSESEARAMFLDEARIAGLIRHPNVVSVVDLGEDEGGPFAVMEFVEGISVARLIAKQAVHPIPLEVVLRIAIQVAEGLHAAHELLGPEGTPLELVHRDVSPQNILLGFDGIARVTDFGIAKALGRVSKTSTGVLKGKLGYISPEQLRFEEPDRRADLFALGVVLFELLSGQRLYRNVGEGMDGPRRILSEPPPDLADYRDDAEPELVALLFELLAKYPTSRPATAKDVVRRLEALLATLTAGGAAIESANFVLRHFEEERRELGERLATARKHRVPSAPVLIVAPATRRPRAFWIAGAAAGALVAAAAGYAARAMPTARAVPSEVQNRTARPAEQAPAKVSAVDIDQPGPDAAPSASAPAVAPRSPRSSAHSRKRSGVPIWERY
jgi:serine/threonine protein kinase